MTKILITGSRSWPEVASDSISARIWLDLIKRHISLDSIEVIVGDCPTGVDKYVREWCAEEEIPLKVFNANWNKYGRSAGPIRNKEMVDNKPDLCYAFYYGASKGTRNCVSQALEAGIRVIETRLP